MRIIKVGVAMFAISICSRLPWMFVCNVCHCVQTKHILISNKNLSSRYKSSSVSELERLQLTELSLTSERQEVVHSCPSPLPPRLSSFLLYLFFLLLQRLLF